MMGVSRGVFSRALALWFFMSSSAMAATFTSTGSGNFSAVVGAPAAGDAVVIAAGHTVTLDVSVSISGLTVTEGATFRFDPSKSVTLTSTKNMIVYGRFEMKPASVAQVHTLRFTGISEEKFVGGGMVPLDTDVGLWVMGPGQLDLLGAAKTSWTRAAGAIAQGASSLTLEAAPNGWNVGDELAIAPTEATSNSTYMDFDNRSVIGQSGATIQLNSGVVRARPMVNGKWTAEVMNLTRNVRIEGTAAGHSHVFIRSDKVQSVRFVQIRYMGPRKDRNGDGVKDFVLGRYALHFHHGMDGSRGSMVEGNVVRDTTSHSYVPHMSHGVTLVDNVAYNVEEDAFWYDQGERTNLTLMKHNIAALVKFELHALQPLNISFQGQTDDPSFGSHAFNFGPGDENVAIDNVAVGVDAIGENGAGYNWEADNEGVWIFENNLAHNNVTGLRAWQNSMNDHVIGGYTAYHNEIGMIHGAYNNSYKYHDSIFYENAENIILKASSANSNAIRFENILIDGAGTSDYLLHVIDGPLPGNYPVQFRNVTMKGLKPGKFSIYYGSSDQVKTMDFVNADIQEPMIYIPNDVNQTEVIRFQPATGQPFMLKPAAQAGGTLNATYNAKRTDIGVFAPTNWGTGTGLKAEYFDNPQFTGTPVVRRDSLIPFWEFARYDQGMESGPDVSYNIAFDDLTYSIRWTGQIEGQFDEDYTLALETAGATRVTVCGQVVFDQFFDFFRTFVYSKPVRLKPGQKCDLKVEYSTDDPRTGITLGWQSKSQPYQIVPQTQLYPAAGIPDILSPITNPVAMPTSAPPPNSTPTSPTCVRHWWTSVTCGASETKFRKISIGQ